MPRDLDRCRLDISGRLVDAMRVLDEGAAGIALVTDGEGRLAGTMTDGDVRRALLAGATLESALAPHVCRTFTAVGPEAGRTEVLDLMQARSVHQIPVLDSGGRLVALHLLHELLGAVERPHWAVVMAGGRGARLSPLTDRVPKPMMRVAGRPILERIVLHLVGFGVTRVFLAVNYLGHLIEEHFGDGSRFGCRITYLREPRPLGTGGALSLLPGPPSDPLIVMNGDLVTEVDVAAMLEAHRRRGSTVTLGIRPHVQAVPYGCVELEGTKIVGMQEKPQVTRWINAGIYVLSPEVVARVPADAEIDLPTLVASCIGSGEPVHGFLVEGDWIDIGRADQLQRARGDDG